MKVIVCLKEVIDTTLDLGFGRAPDALVRKGLSCRLDPLDLQALAEALRIKAQSAGVEVTLLTLGPERLESYLYDGLALGADQAVRVWEEDCPDWSPFQKSKVLAGVASLLEADLVLMGSRSLDNGSGLVSPLTAAWLDRPFAGEVVNFQVEGRTAAVTRSAGKGIQEKVLVSLPLVLAITAGRSKLPYASLDRILVSREAAVRRLSLSDLGISPLELKDDPTRVAGLSFPLPRPKAAPYDSSIPAFYRILALLQGGIAKRRGQVLQGDTRELVDQLYALLVKEEVIEPPALP
jgi:electron transfer flavoprotein beta subunit